MSDDWKPNATDLRGLIREVAFKHNVTPAQIRSETREGHVVIARHAVFYWARHHLKLTYPAIGKQLKKDHSTVINGCKRYAAFLKGEVYVNVKAVERSARNCDERRFRADGKRYTRPWSDEDVRTLLDGAAAGRTSSEVGMQLGRSSVDCKYKLFHLRKAGVTDLYFVCHNGAFIYNPIVWFPERVARLREMIAAGKVAAEVAAELKVSSRSVRSYVSKLRLSGENIWFANDPHSPANLAAKSAAPPKPAKIRPEKPKVLDPSDAFLAALREHEQQPSNAVVKDRQPLRFNPSLYQGGLGASSANMD